ncbi:MAG: EAL domain-containing protein [Oscillospiraceae bacterium]
MIKKYTKKLLSLIAALAVSVFIFPLNSSAVKEGEPIVVGVNPDYGISSIGGHYSGFALDYIREIQKRTGQSFTYVEGTAPELAAMLAHGKVDIIPCVSKNELNAWQGLTSAAGPEEPITLALSDISLTMKYISVYARENSSMPLYFDDYETLKSSRIGYLKEDYNKYFINSAFIGTDLRKATFVGYDSESQMKSDFESGKIDAVVKDSFRAWENEIIVYQVCSNDCYFMASAENSDLLELLDEIVAGIFLTDSSFSSSLFEKHVSRYKCPHFALTAAEQNYLNRNPEIKVAFNMQSSQTEYYDGNSKKIVGTTAVMMDNLSTFSNMKLTLVPYDTLKDCVAALNNGEVQAICGGVNSYSTSNYPELRVSAPYARVPIAAAGKPGSTLNARSRIAVAVSDDDISQFISDLYPSAQILHYQTISQCFEAVRRGESDLVFSGAYDLLSMINERYSELELVDVESSFHSECLAFPVENEVLYHILGKAIACYDYNSSQMDAYTNITGAAATSTASDQFIDKYLVWVIAGILLILAAIFIVVCVTSFRNRRDTDVDTLTGGRSKKKFFEDAKKLLRRESPENWAVALFDIDKFKYVNDRLGYDEGNRMLERLHKTVSDHLDRDEIFARIADDNFVMVIKDANDNELTARITEIFNEFDRRNSLFVKYPVVFSAGICRLNLYMHESRRGEVDINAAIDRCKIAQSTLKGKHYSSIAFYDGSIRDRALREKDYESIMPAALKRREFQCYLQPKYGLRTRNIEGAEALIRWNSPDFGFISPGDFIPIAEKNGFVVELDFFILEEVCRTMRHWIDEGKKPVVVSVNQSRLHLNYDDYIWRLREIVDKYDIPYEYIELELTESVFTDNSEKLLKIMHKLHETGFKLSLDDFGSGYSSLNMLKDIPVDVVKIDKEFFNDTMNTQKGRAVISTVVDLAKNLDMDVISEGVETREQVEFLTEIHCAMVQGYYFAKPMPIADFEKLWYADLEEIHCRKEKAAAQQQRRLDAMEQHATEQKASSTPAAPAEPAAPKAPEAPEATDNAVPET